MQGLVHAVLIKIVKAYTFSFMTGRGKTTIHSSQTRADGEGVVRKPKLLGLNKYRNFSTEVLHTWRQYSCCPNLGSAL